MTSTTFFFVFIPLLAIILLAVNLIFAPHNPYQEKDSAFECGFHSFLGQNRTQFSISFFIFALLFLLFDLEILLVYPYVVSAYTNSIYGLVIMLIFFLALTLGFAFELGHNALKIESRQTIIKNNRNLTENTYIKDFINTKNMAIVKSSMFTGLLKLINIKRTVYLFSSFYAVLCLKLSFYIGPSFITFNNLYLSITCPITILNGLIIGLFSILLRLLFGNSKINIKSIFISVLFVLFFLVIKLYISDAFYVTTWDEFFNILNKPLDCSEWAGWVTLFGAFHGLSSFIGIVWDEIKYPFILIKDNNNNVWLFKTSPQSTGFNRFYSLSDLLNSNRVKLTQGPLDEFEPKLYNAMASTGGESSKGTTAGGEPSKSPTFGGEPSKSHTAGGESSKGTISYRAFSDYIWKHKSPEREAYFAYHEYKQNMLHPNAAWYYLDEISRLKSLPSLTPDQQNLFYDYDAAIKKAHLRNMHVETAAKHAGLTVDQLGEKYSTVLSEIKKENNKRMWDAIDATDRNREEATKKVFAESLLGLRNSNSIPENVSKVTSDSSLTNPKGKGKE